MGKKREVIKQRMARRWKLWFQCYQMAGSLLLIPEGDSDDPFTKGQRARLTELLLNTLSEPQRYSARVVRDLEKMALEE